METLKTLGKLAELLQSALDKGNPNCVTDAGVASRLMLAAAKGAAYNVRINLADLRDRELAAELQREMQPALQRVVDVASRSEAEVESAVI